MAEGVTGFGATVSSVSQAATSATPMRATDDSQRARLFIESRVSYMESIPRVISFSRLAQPPAPQCAGRVERRMRINEGASRRYHADITLEFSSCRRLRGGCPLSRGSVR